VECPDYFWFSFGNCNFWYISNIKPVICALQRDMHGKVPERSFIWPVHDNGCVRKSLVKTQWSYRQRMREGRHTMAVLW
jgi:hypothetical protein